MIIQNVGASLGLGPEVSRQYLEQFFPNKKCLVITDSAIAAGYTATNLVKQLPDLSELDLVIIDVTHNPWPFDQSNDIKIHNLLDTAIASNIDVVVLSNDYRLYYNPQEYYMFFPLYLWMFSLRDPLWWNDETMVFDIVFDVESNKTQGLSSLNRNPSFHRIVLFNNIIHKPWFDKIAYTFGHFSWHAPLELNCGLLDEEIQTFKNNQHRLPILLADTDTFVSATDYGLNHWTHIHSAFNLVTETAVDDRFFCSEKTCKPLMAKQIPIFIGPRGLSQFCEDIGLDMFSDIIPWKTWDSNVRSRGRVLKVVEFLDSLMEQDLLALYKTLETRVDRNKEYFHSEEFRKKIMQQMPKY
jgi:hypothetical protein